MFCIIFPTKHFFIPEVLTVERASSAAGDASWSKTEGSVDDNAPVINNIIIYILTIIDKEF